MFYLYKFVSVFMNKHEVRYRAYVWEELSHAAGVSQFLSPLSCGSRFHMAFRSVQPFRHGIRTYVAVMRRQTTDRGVARKMFRGWNKRGVSVPSGVAPDGVWGSPQKPEKHAKHSIECHKFCTVYREKFQRRISEGDMSPCPSSLRP